MGVRRLVCLPTILISISVTVIEGTLKECILSADSLTNAIRDALSVSLFKERLREQNSSMLSLGQASKSSKKKQGASPQASTQATIIQAQQFPAQKDAPGKCPDPQLLEQGHSMQRVSSPCPFSSTHRNI